jgi:hypothetical protein
MSSGEAGLVGATLFGKDTRYRMPENVHKASDEASTADGAATSTSSTRMRTCPRHHLVGGAERRPGAGHRRRGRRQHDCARDEVVKAAVAKGAAVVRSSRTNGGIIRRNIEVMTTSWARSPRWS